MWQTPRPILPSDEPVANDPRDRGDVNGKIGAFQGLGLQGGGIVIEVRVALGGIGDGRDGGQCREYPKAPDALRQRDFGPETIRDRQQRVRERSLLGFVVPAAGGLAA